MKKKYTRESLMRYSKDDFVEEVLIARHNWQSAEESLANQAKGYESICHDWKPERHGRWVATNPSEPELPVYECSVCEHVGCVRVKLNYCPHCGAKMDLEAT